MRSAHHAVADAAARSTSERLTRVQAASGLAFAVFLGLHLTNTLAAMIGAGIYDGVQDAFQRFYQFPVLEVGLGLALGVHAACGVVRLARGGPRRGARLRLHRASGVVLLLVAFGHALATRGVALAGGVETGFDAPAFSLVWLPAWFYPYYFLLGTAGIYHGWNGTLTALARLGWRLPHALMRGPGFWLVPILGPLGVAIALAGFGGWLYPIDDPMASGFARFYLDLLG